MNFEPRVTLSQLRRIAVVHSDSILDDMLGEAQGNDSLLLYPSYNDATYSTRYKNDVAPPLG